MYVKMKHRIVFQKICCKCLNNILYFATANMLKQFQITLCLFRVELNGALTYILVQCTFNENQQKVSKNLCLKLRYFPLNSSSRSTLKIQNKTFFYKLIMRQTTPGNVRQLSVHLNMQFISLSNACITNYSYFQFFIILRTIVTDKCKYVCHCRGIIYLFFYIENVIIVFNVSSIVFIIYIFYIL